MKFKKIILNNIRSYENQEVEFPEGSTLLSGDIGSGKTSILLGLEFALFGLQPGQKGISLLRNGKNFGGVVVEFEVNGKEVVIERNLKRGKNISQESCKISVDGNLRELSVMELKSAVLELLNYPREFSKKQNLLYKFTVYTPQEEMKQIILQDSETRTNTLRYIFGVEKYKRIFENTNLLVSKLREERKIGEGSIMNLQQDKSNLLSKESELEEKNYNLISIEKEFFLKSEERKKVQEEKEELEKKINEKKIIEQEIEKLGLKIIHKKETLSGNLKIIENNRTQISELESTLFDESGFKSLEESLALEKKEKEKLNEELVLTSSQISLLIEKNTENEEIIGRISHIENCPTCMQKVDSAYKENISSRINDEIKTNSLKMGSLNSEKQSLLDKSIKINSKIAEIENKLREMNILKIKKESLDSKKKEISEFEKLNGELNREIAELEVSSVSLKSSLESFKTFETAFESKRSEFESSLREEKLAEIKVAELKKEIEIFSINIEELRERIKRSEEVKEKINYLVELENWLSKDFVNMVSVIEKNIMIKLKSEFSRIFSEWFSMLVSENFNVYVRDDFTPVIELQDYEIDYSYLSGGERTAIALAYRLALNQLINSVLSNIETKDIVILDEPTDGFSDMQLDKMRDVLHELNVGQLIIVSHEQKIEGFVENVMRLKKENGSSVIN